MNRRFDETRPPSTVATVLDRVRPTVVVRRRVVDVPPDPQSPQTSQVPASARPAPRMPGAIFPSTAADDDENGPPSSVNVARALRSLRADELHRVEEIVRADDDTPPAALEPPSVRVGKTIALAELADRMSLPKQELVTALVTRGFFSVTVKTVLPRDTARIVATMFRWRIEDDDTVDVPELKAAMGSTAPSRTRANKPVAAQRPTKAPKAKRSPKKLPTKKRSTSRNR